jgi:hypothetical protein
MKLRLTLLIALLLTTLSWAWSQQNTSKLSFGVFAGPNLSRSMMQSYRIPAYSEPKIGYSLQGRLKIQFAESMALRAGLGTSLARFDYVSTYQLDYGPIYRSHYQIHSQTIDLFAGWQFQFGGERKPFYVAADLAGGIITEPKIKVQNYLGPTRDNVQEVPGGRIKGYFGGNVSCGYALALNNGMQLHIEPQMRLLAMASNDYYISMRGIQSFSLQLGLYF